MKTQPTLPRRPASRSGSTLPATLMVVAAVATFLSLAAALTSQFGRYAGRQQGTNMEAVFADAALEFAYAQWHTLVYTATTSGIAMPSAASLKTTLVNSKPTFLSTTFPHGSQLGIDTDKFLSDSDSLVIEAVDQNGRNASSYGSGSVVASTRQTQATDIPPRSNTKSVEGYPGWMGFTYNYLAKVKIKSTRYGTNSDEYYQARRYFKVTRVPLCQAVAFYEGDLEIHPGADMYLNGPVHSNRRIFAQAIGVGLKLQFTSNVSYVTSFNDGTSNPDVTLGWGGANTKTNIVVPEPYRPYSPTRYSDGGAAQAYSGGTVANTSYPAVPASTVKNSQVAKVDPIDPFGGATTSNNGLRDIIEVPTVPSTSDQIAYNNANLFIEVNSSTANLNSTANQITPATITVKVRNAATNILEDANSTDRSAVLSAINNGLTSSMQDKRESATVYVTNLDMAKLDTITTMPTNASTATPLQKAFNKTSAQGGTVYIHDKSGRTGSTRGAVRLTNGRVLGQNVSVASDNGLYIQGDYNTGGNGASDVQSNGNNAPLGTTPEAAGYSRYAASVMADAVTVLSNAWNDNNSGGDLNARKASATTVNAAILSGDVASNTNKSGIASGGVHNFPRFLEYWSGVNFTYYGSLIQAFNSESYTGYWQTNDVYTWPNRLWSFDTKFIDQQPPGLPQGVQFTRGRWERYYN